MVRVPSAWQVRLAAERPLHQGRCTKKQTSNLTFADSFSSANSLNTVALRYLFKTPTVSKMWYLRRRRDDKCLLECRVVEVYVGFPL